MAYRILADIVMVIHLAFVLFVALGGLLAVRWRRWAWLHAPAAIWGTLIELTGWICPLTPLENHFRGKGGEEGYRTGFIDHYITPVLYPEGLTRRDQAVIGVMLLAINIAVYSWLVWRWRKHQ